MDAKKEHDSYFLSKVRRARTQPDLTTSVEDYLEAREAINEVREG